MIKKLHLITVLFFCNTVFPQIAAGQVDDFEDGTVLNWTIGVASAGTENISSGGPNGQNDRFLSYTATGLSGPAGRVVIFNANAQWSGNFISENILEIQFQARAITNDLHLRLAFQGPMGTRIVSTNPVLVPEGSGWTTVSIPINESAFIVVQGPASVLDVLEAVSTMRILSNPVIDNWKGELIAATMNIDNITASTTLGVPKQQNNISFSIYPNPGTNRLNVGLPPNHNFSKLAVYNILGSKVYEGPINAVKASVNISQWPNGVYLVQVSNAKKTISKRFVKQ
ncbi:T9SS type A sorting domain-containing protein [Bizionia sediminis]|uniref:T9SS type A sorting domain-containing protein n=1 Tax=Bizionia sediminis TaxID=1737064 RepID=A0ABW5KRW7_9FLAO